MARKKNQSRGQRSHRTAEKLGRAAPATARSVRPADDGQEPGDVGPAESSIPIVGIGASAGGIEALTHLFRSLPADTGMAFVVVQHLDPTHASMLTEIISRVSPMPVAEIRDRMPVASNHVYVIPPGSAMNISAGVLQLSPRGDVRGQPRVIDRFFRSLAEDRKHAAIGVVLSGSATDGTNGLEAIKAEGGITFAQDETAQHRSMPQSAMAAGCVDFVLPPDQIAAEIARISRHPYVVVNADSPRGPSLEKVLEQIRHATGVDFGQYKRTTIYRRVHRRAVLHKMDGLANYERFLEGNAAEIETLYQDVLINVTSFFRNPEAFEVLREKVFPTLTKDRSRHEPVRIWVLGCSTGEEAYSIAIAYHEAQEALGRRIPVQVFATDLNGAGIEQARAGVYPKAIAQDVSPERLRRYFVEVDGSYRVIKEIRDVCVFARHNVLTDPPFSRIDLVSCRNLLIYFEPVLQQRVVPMLHYSLRPSGFLWLGTSETIGSYRDLFEMEDSKLKIYRRRNGQQMAVPVTRTRRREESRVRQAPSHAHDTADASVEREAERILLAKYTPPSVLINGDLEILQFRGDTGQFLTPPSGRASFNLLKMLREGLLVAVRAAIHRAKREQTPVTEEGLRVKSDGEFRRVSVHVVPVKSGVESLLLVLFEGAPASPSEPVPSGATRRRRGAPAAGSSEHRARESGEAELRRLQQELSATREYLQSVIEQQEAANEELQSANEEVQSANEELQSINEELETSKEEVQSSNEELATLNEELHNRNAELGLINNDLINLLNSVQIPILILGPDLRIRRFTSAAEKVFSLIHADIGRPFGNVRLNVNVDNLEGLVSDVIDTAVAREVEVQDGNGRLYSLRIRPYRTLDNRIDGAVVLVVDAERLQRSQDTVRRQDELLDQVVDPIVAWEFESGTITYWSRGAETAYGFSREQALGQSSSGLLATTPPASAFKPELERDGLWRGELTQRRADGERVRVDSRMMIAHEVTGAPVVIETSRQIPSR